MPAYTLRLLSPYQLPGKNSLYLADDDIACFLNGLAGLWHPACLAVATGIPESCSAYEHETPSPAHIYAVPSAPASLLPDDWEDRLREAGSISFKCTMNRVETWENLLQALKSAEVNGLESQTMANITLEEAHAFAGAGLAYYAIDALFEAMDHEKLLDRKELWEELRQAATADNRLESLACAVRRLQSAREVVYPVSIYLLDLLTLEAAPFDLDWAVLAPKLHSCNVLLSGRRIHEFKEQAHERFAAFASRCQDDDLEIVGGAWEERQDAFAPLDVQVDNLRRGVKAVRELLNKEVRTHARSRASAHPFLSQVLHAAGLQKTIFLSFDAGVLPTFQSAVVNLPSPDGKQVEAFTRVPFPAESPQTYFHFAHYLHKSIAQDHTATIAFLRPPAPMHASFLDLIAVSRLAPVLGQWTTFAAYFAEALAGEYASAPQADDFHIDYLSERAEARSPNPVSGFVDEYREYRGNSTRATMIGLARGLLGKSCPQIDNESQAASIIASRILSRASGQTPGWLLFNPSGVTRRAAVAIEGVDDLPPVGGPLKAAQLEGKVAHMVVEIPALGFAWVAQKGATGQKTPSRFRLADERGVRNEHFEAEIDPVTGGLRAARDPRTRVNRIGQQLVHHAGSTMRCETIKVVHSGQALGEVETRGAILDPTGQPLATYKQSLRAWAGRPILQVAISIEPLKPLLGYPWQSYFGCRFAWRDERATLVRGVCGQACITAQNRPQSSDFIEVRSGSASTVILPAGLQFHQREGNRMLDVLLLTPGEERRSFEIGIGLDRRVPMQAALGFGSALPLVPVSSGPPHVGATGWLFYLDSTNLALLRLEALAQGLDGVVFILLECSGFGGQAELRCVRTPIRAVVENGIGEPQYQASIEGDTIRLDYSASELIYLRVEFE